MADFTIEQLDKVLDYPTIEAVELGKLPDEYFERRRKFVVDGHEYMIEWWANISYLHVPGGAIIPFHTVKQSNTWPRRSKMNLQFYYGMDQVCCILKIEDWAKQSDPDSRCAGTKDA